jgi:asparagine synthase (glutamine-hydrolysing)
MCGIAGIVGTHGRGVDPLRLEEMIAALAHRGPDESGVHVGDGVGFAHSRLNIIDAAGGRQPMANGDGSVWITFNGEIFNFPELRNELIQEGYRFRSRSDTEVLLRLYEAEGRDAVRRLNGQWAFAIWDTRTRTLFLSRDRMGVRPLFYSVTPQGFLFASEIKALFAHPAVSRDLDPKGLDNVFTFWSTLAPRTMFKDVRELPPGHSLTWHDGRIEIAPHWQPSYPSADGDHRSERECADTLRALLTEATRIRLRSDVPVGAYVSGGLDSSVIAALGAQFANGPAHTFSISFDDAELDESPLQREVVDALGTDHHELRCSNAMIGQAFPDVIWHAEQPLLRTAAAPMFLLSKMVRDLGYKAVLTGEGADEVLGGYDIFKEAKIRRFWAQFPASRRRPLLLRRLYPYQRELQRQPAAYLKAFFHVTGDDVTNPFFSHLPRWTLTSRLKTFFSDEMRASLGSYDGYAELAARLPAAYRQWDPFCQAQYLETVQLMPGYILSSQGDRMAMAHGVEGRFPFLDPNVVAFASGLSPAMKMKVLDEKHLLKVCARDLVPERILRRPKQPYRAPDGKAFFGSATGMAFVDDLLSPAQIRRDGIFRPDAVDHLVRKFKAGRATGVKDNMALVGILSTQILIDRFVNTLGKATHAGHQARSASVHCR